MRTDIITGTSFVIDDLTARITSNYDSTSKIDAMVSGTKFGMNIHMNLILELCDSECLGVVERFLGEGYATYTHELFPNHRFTANAYFEREGKEWELSELDGDKLRVEVIS